MTMINEKKFYQDRLTGSLPYLKKEIDEYENGNSSDATIYRLLKYNKMLCETIEKLNGRIEIVECKDFDEEFKIIKENYDNISKLEKTKNGKFKFKLDLSKTYFLTYANID